MKMLLGNIESNDSLDLAESALIVATLQSGRLARSRFALTCGPDRRLFIRRHENKYMRVGKYNSGVKTAEWIATFTKQADPDWLAEEIEGARL